VLASAKELLGIIACRLAITGEPVNPAYVWATRPPFQTAEAKAIKDAISGKQRVNGDSINLSGRARRQGFLLDCDVLHITRFTGTEMLHGLAPDKNA
jgi:hypothetical protein